MSENKIFSVIIPTRHRNDQLCACLERLKPGQQSLPFESYEVIVSDDGEDSSAEQAVQMNYPWALWVPGPRRGPAANRNNGASFAGGQWLVFTDDDCLPDSFWLSSFQAAMQATAVEAMEGAIYPIGDPDRDLAHCPSNLQGGYFWSANIAVARGLFQKLGGFDERYRFADHEDEDLRMRASVHTDIVFVPEARVGHPVRVSSLPEALSSIPKRTQSWVCHIFKHQHTLGYADKRSYVRGWVRYWLKEMLAHIRLLHLKSALVAFAMAMTGPVLIPRYLAREQAAEDTC